MDIAETESRIAAFLAKYTPVIESQAIEARARLRALFPRGYELIYDNYNALVFGISPTERTPDAFVSIACYPKWITLFFLQGATLHDPAGLLEGTGKQVRGIRLKKPEDIAAPEVRALVAQAAAPHQAAFAVAPVLVAIIKSVSAKQQPRRAA